MNYGLKMSRFDVLIMSDSHIRLDSPSCRIDDFIKTQTNKLLWIKEFSKQYEVPILFAGDKFHRASSSPSVEAYAINYAPDVEEIIIPGNHDLKEKNIKNCFNSSIYIYSLGNKKAKFITEKTTIDFFNFMLNCFPWGTSWTPLTEEEIEKKKKPLVGMGHLLTARGKDADFIGAEEAFTFLSKMKGYDLIILGDNHKPFLVEDDDRYLLSPGSITRQRCSEIHIPCIWGWEVGSAPVSIAIPHESNAISREHTQKQEEIQEKIGAFVALLSDGYEVSLSFEDNIRKSINNVQLEPEVEELIWRVLEKK